jgi:hypothetical protein
MPKEVQAADLEAFLYDGRRFVSLQGGQLVARVLANSSDPRP